MNNTVEDIINGNKEALYISGPERIQGVPQKALKRLRLIGGNLERRNTTLFSKGKENKRSARRRAVAGPSSVAGQYQVEVTPEGGFPRFLNMGLKLISSTTIAVPVNHYRHRFGNQFGSKTYTLYHVMGDKIFIYPGSRITGDMSIAIDKEAGEVLALSATISALDQLSVTLDEIPTALDDLGITAAGADILAPYSPVDCEATLAGQQSPIKTVTVSFNAEAGVSNILDRKRGGRGTFEKMGDATATATAYFEDMKAVYLDQGVVPSEVEGLSGTTKAIITAPFEAHFYPQENASGYSNELALIYPSNKVTVVEQPGNGSDEVMQQLTVETLDDGTDPDGDFLADLTNGETNASLIAPSAVLPSALILRADKSVSEVKHYSYGPAADGATTTVITVEEVGHFRDKNDFYNGKQLMLLEGANAGQTRTITDYAYDAGTGAATFTVNAAFTAAPAEGQHVGVVV